MTSTLVPMHWPISLTRRGPLVAYGISRSRSFSKTCLRSTILDFRSAPSHPLSLNTEFVGQTYPTKTIDNTERLAEHTLRHARVHNQLASNVQYAGVFGWCAFDYNTHFDFGSGDRICYQAVADIFREPKPAAVSINRSATRRKRLCWSRPSAGHAATNPSDSARVLCAPTAITSSFFVDDKLVTELDPDRNEAE
jgi:beta-galactosidase